MADATRDDAYENRGDSWAKALATLALIISVLASVVAYSAYNRSLDALDRANQKIESIDSSSSDGSKAPGLMNGTQDSTPEAAPAVPPTQEAENQDAAQ